MDAVMGLLDGGLQQIFGDAFNAVLPEGRHYHQVEDRDVKGNASATVTKVQSVRAMRQTVTAQLQAAGFADAAAVLIVMRTFDGRQTDPVMRGDRIKLEGVTWVCGNIDEDGAHAAQVVGVTPA